MRPLRCWKTWWWSRPREVSLVGASLDGTDLRDADLEESNLVAAELSSTKLAGANLHWCDLGTAMLIDTELTGANLARVSFDRTILANLDLSEADGLRAVRPEGPSSVGTDTLERTLAAVAGDAKRLQDVEAFFRGAGVPEHLIAHYRSRAGVSERYYPAYIVHDRSDTGLAQILYEELQARGVRCWLNLNLGFGPPPALGRSDWRGERVILCASTTALEGEWAQAEIAGAISARRPPGRDGLIVVDLDGCLRDASSGGHAWIRSRVVADLSELESGEGRLEETIERVMERLRTGQDG